MGRAMLIIMAGVIVGLGYIGIGTAEQGKQIIGRNAEYAEIVTAKNTAHTAIQMAMQQMNEDSTWAENHGEGNAWTGTIEGKSFDLYVEYIHDSPDYWASDTIRVVSKSTYRAGVVAEVISVYEMNSLDYVPDFLSPLTIATENFNYSQDGSSAIQGFEQSGAAGCEDKAGITVMNDDINSTVAGSSEDVQGDPPIQTDTTLNYQPTDQLIARLYDSPNKTIVSGNYGGDMGSAEDPGVFFVEDYAKLNGKTPDGYGILVIRKGGEMAMEDSTGAEMHLNGNFKFNGLVIFEDAYNLKGNGTPFINGSVLIGNTEGYTGEDINIDISGNITMQYDCTAENYAKKAASLAVKGNKYKRLTTFE